MNLQEQRHLIEYEVLPEALLSEHGSEAVQAILLHNRNYFIRLYNTLNKDNPDYVCPYKPADFGFDALMLGTNLAALMRITMPPIEAAGDMIRIYIGHDNKLQRIRLYTVRIDENSERHFMTWVDDSHYYDHGIIKCSEAQENKEVFDLYVKYWLESEKESK